MEISVIIATYNRAPKISASLEALKQQSRKDFEVVIVVDGSSDDTIQVLERFQHDFASFKVVSIENSGRAIARNRGAQAASGRYFIFIDDDIRLFENAVALHCEFHLGLPGQIVFGQLELDPSIEGANDFLNYRRRIESRWIQQVKQEISFENYGFTTANLSMRRETFNQLGGFDPALRDSEDFDFSIRALLLNIPLKYEPALRGYHDDFTTISQYILRQKEYFKSKYFLLQKHPGYRELLPAQFHWMDNRPGDSWKKWMFGRSEFWLSLFSGNLFRWLPSVIRDRLYSSFIYTQSVLLIRHS